MTIRITQLPEMPRKLSWTWEFTDVTQAMPRCLRRHQKILTRSFAAISLQRPHGFTTCGVLMRRPAREGQDKLVRFVRCWMHTKPSMDFLLQHHRFIMQPRRMPTETPGLT